MGKRSYILSSLTTGILSSYLTSQTLVPRIKRQSTGGILMSVHCNSYIVRLLGATQIVISRYPSYSLVITQLFCKSKLYPSLYFLWIYLSSYQLCKREYMNNSYSGKCLDQLPRTSLEVPFSAASCQILHVYSLPLPDPEAARLGRQWWQRPRLAECVDPPATPWQVQKSRIRKVVGSQKCEPTCQQQKEPAWLKSSLSLCLHSETLQPFHNQYPMLMASDFKGKVRKKLGHLNRRTECLPAT